MKKMLIALDDEKIFEQMKKSGKYLIYKYDISYKEGVIEFLAQNSMDIIITKDYLNGEMTKEIFAKQLRMVAQNSKIIFFVENIDNDYKRFLFSQEIFNIIEENITFRRLFELIESDKYELLYKDENKIKTEQLINENPKVEIVAKQIISIFGTSGAGKSYVASLLGTIISKKLKLNTLVIDLDIQNPATDIYNNINGESNSLYYIMEEIDNETFSSSTFKDTLNFASGNKKLSFITNNLDIYECQNRLSSFYYKKLYKEAKENFDITIVDVPASPFLDIVPFSLMQSDKIFFVVNPNFISVRQAIKYLELILNVWNIDKNKIYIIINKTTNHSLSEKQLQSIFRGYNILINIENNENIEQIINGGKILDDDKIKNFQKIFEIIGIKNNILNENNMQKSKEVKIRR